MSGPVAPPLEVTEVDGSPDGRPITKIIVSNGDLSISGRTATIDTSGSGGSPGTPAKSIQYNSDPAGTFTGSERLLFETGSNQASIYMKSGASATQTEIKAVDGWGMQITATDTDSSARNQISLFGENDAPDGILLIPNTGENVVLQTGGLTTSASDGDLVLSTYDDEDKAKITLTAGADGDVLVQTDNAGVLQLENTTTDADSVLSIMGNGTGDAKLDMQNASKRVWVLCDENKKLKIQGGSGGNTFILDVSGAATGITFPDGTTQTTAATGGGVTFPLEADDGGGASAPSYSFDGDTNTGMFRLAGDTLGLAVGGSAAMYFQTTKVEANKDFECIAGSAASPSLMFASDNDTGLYSLAANKIGFATGGVARLGIGDAGEILVGGSAAGTDGQVLTSGGSGAAVAWEDAGGGGATELSGLSDVLIDATNWTNGLLIQTNSGGSAPTTGTLSGANNNIGIGADVLKAVTSADNGIYLGEECGIGITTGSNNVAVGIRSMGAAGAGTGTQNNNVAVGYKALSGILNGANANVAIGYQCMQNGSFSGDDNVCVGEEAGSSITSGSRNLCIGVGSGNITTGDSNTIIGYGGGSSSTDDKQLEITSGGSVGTVSFIVGDSAGSCYQGDNATTWSTTSDQRLKREITDATVGLDAINAVQVRNFHYIEKAEKIVETDDEGNERVVGYDGDNRYNLDPEPLRVGVIAQEIQEVFPESVKENVHGHLIVNTDTINWALLKAVQELSAKVEALEANQ